MPDIHDQIDFPKDLALFIALNKVCQKYDIHKHFGHHLHHHFIFSENCIILKLNVDANISLTKMTRFDFIEEISVHGVMYLLNDVDNFQAYELEHEDAIDISLPFLEELSEIL